MRCMRAAAQNQAASHITVILAFFDKTFHTSFKPHICVNY